MKKKVKKRERTPKKYTHEEWLQSLEYNGFLERHNSNMIKDYTNMFFRVLQDNFNFERKEFELFVEKLNELAELIEDGQFTWQDLNNSILEELEVKYIIR